MRDRTAPARHARDVKPMDEQTRYRVTGGLFLLAVAVVVLPMLLDGEGLAPVEIEPLDVPGNTPELRRRVDVAPATDLLERAAELASQVDDAGFQAQDGGTRFGEPVLTEAGADTRVWAVQLASFEKEANALKLRDRLRGEGREAFISTVKHNGRILSRVAVGPFLDQSLAEAARAELSDELSLDVRLVAFSN